MTAVCENDVGGQPEDRGNIHMRGRLGDGRNRGSDGGSGGVVKAPLRVLGVGETFLRGEVCLSISIFSYTATEKIIVRRSSEANLRKIYLYTKCKPKINRS